MPKFGSHYRSFDIVKSNYAETILSIVAITINEIVLSEDGTKA